MHADVLVGGGGTGGVAAALGALRAGRGVLLTEEYDWLGGQLTSQAEPPDEHTWIEQFGATASYRALREGIRDYRRNFPLTAPACRRRDLNPGAGWVSRLCHEPRVSVAVKTATAAYVLDGTETGELRPLTGTEFVTGFEAQGETGELSAPENAQSLNRQAVSYCFALDHVDGDHTIDRPANHDHWSGYQPPFRGAPTLSRKAPQPRTLELVERGFTPDPGDDPAEVIADQRVSGGDMNLWVFRRIAARDNFVPGAYASDITLVNWPVIDCLESPVIDVPDTEASGRRQEPVVLPSVLDADTGPARRRRHRLPRSASARRRHRQRRRAGAGAVPPRVPSYPRRIHGRRAGPVPGCPGRQRLGDLRRFHRRRHVPHRPASIHWP